MTPGSYVAPRVESPSVEAMRSLIFGKTGAEMPDSGTTLLSERELQLVAELQRAPRASWAAVGARLGVTAATVSRVWQRMSGEGLAWVTTYPVNLVSVVGYIWVTVQAGKFEQVTAEMARHPSVYWLERVDGVASLFAGFGAASPRLAERVIAEVESVPGVLHVRVQFSRLVVRDGSHWMPDSAPANEPRRGHGWRPERSGSHSPSPGEWAAYRLLARNGRASFTELAEHSGVSERTLRRKLPALIELGLLSSRCDVARESLGFPLGMFVSLDIQQGWQAVAAQVANWSSTRLVALTSGPAPLLLHFWVRSTLHGTELAERVAALAPDARITNIEFSLRAYKRMNRIVGPTGVVVGAVDFGEVPTHM